METIDIDFFASKADALQAMREGGVGQDEVNNFLNNRVGSRVRCFCDIFWGPYPGDPEVGHDQVFGACDMVKLLFLPGHSIPIWQHSCGYVFFGDRAPNGSGYVVFTEMRLCKDLNLGGIPPSLKRDVGEAEEAAEPSPSPQVSEDEVDRSAAKSGWLARIFGR